MVNVYVFFPGSWTANCKPGLVGFLDSDVRFLRMEHELAGWSRSPVGTPSVWIGSLFLLFIFRGKNATQVMRLCGGPSDDEVGGDPCVLGHFSVAKTSQGTENPGKL